MREPRLRLVENPSSKLTVEEEALKTMWTTASDLLARIEDIILKGNLEEEEQNLTVLITTMRYKYNQLIQDQMRTLVQNMASNNRIKYLEKVINNLEEPQLKFLINALLAEKFNPMFQENQLLRAQVKERTLEAAKFETLYHKVLAEKENT